MVGLEDVGDEREERVLAASGSGGQSRQRVVHGCVAGAGGRGCSVRLTRLRTDDEVEDSFGQTFAGQVLVPLQRLGDLAAQGRLVGSAQGSDEPEEFAESFLLVARQEISPLARECLQFRDW